MDRSATRWVGSERLWLRGEHRDFTDVEALVFDVFGTVVDWPSRVAREPAAFLALYAPGAVGRLR